MASATPIQAAPQHFYQRAAEALTERLAYLRALMPSGANNNTELGGMCEQALRDALRATLPMRFGVGYGHICLGGPTQAGSKPLDVIVYDQLVYGPVFRDGEFVVVPPQAVCGVVEVKANLTAAELKKAAEKQVKAAFDTVSWDQGRWGERPGFVLGYSGTNGNMRAKVPSQAQSLSLMGVVDLAAQWSTIRRGARWYPAQTHGFAYWYWRLLEAIYTRVGSAEAPLPDGYEEHDVQF